MRRLLRLRVSRGAAPLAAIALLAGCAQPLPVASPDPVPPVPPPVVGAAQQQRILADLAKDMEAADKALSIDPVAPRITEPASTMRKAEYAAASKKVADAVVKLGFTEAGSIVAASDTWPRDYFVVADPPEGAQSFRVFVLTQDSAHDNYRLWGWVRPFGGVTLPKTVDASIGSLPLSADDKRLKVTPNNTIAQYVDVLNNGSRSKYAANFAKTDELREQYAQDLKVWNAVKTVGGKAAWQHKVGPWGVHALQTGDGGGLVVASEVSTLGVTIKEGSMALPKGSEVAALTGKSSFKKSLSMQYTTTVLFWVPGSGSDAVIQVLGAERVLTKAEGR